MDLKQRAEELECYINVHCANDFHFDKYKYIQSQGYCINVSRHLNKVVGLEGKYTIVLGTVYDDNSNMITQFEIYKNNTRLKRGTIGAVIYYARNEDSIAVLCNATQSINVKWLKEQLK